MSKFDTETVLHKKHVSDIGSLFITELKNRLEHHDDSKFSQDENKLFKAVLDKTANAPYDSDDYNAMLAKLRPALILHYGANRHHPEHFIDGISGMNIIDLLEMFIDWCAATERNKEDDIHKSIDANAKRYDLPDELVSIFHNTADDFFLGDK